MQTYGQQSKLVSIVNKIYNGEREREMDFGSLHLSLAEVVGKFKVSKRASWS